MKIFIAGPRSVNELDKCVKQKLENIFFKGYNILIGDAGGIDSSVQRYMLSKKYKNVTVFASNGIARNNYGNWKIENVKVTEGISGFNFYVKKDIEMAKQADIGFMIWNGKSRGTFNNVINCLKLEKEVIIYYIPKKCFFYLKTIDELYSFLNENVKLDYKLKQLLPLKKDIEYAQVCLF